jgi:hypothetical protein
MQGHGSARLNRNALTPRKTSRSTTNLGQHCTLLTLATMSKQSTVVEQKQSFLSSRKHLLSRGIPPSERLKTIAEDGGIELSVLKGVLDKGIVV